MLNAIFGYESIFFEFQTIYITVVRGKPFFLVSQGEKGNCFPVMGH